jgi:hypothetical protein
MNETTAFMVRTHTIATGRRSPHIELTARG